MKYYDTYGDFFVAMAGLAAGAYALMFAALQFRPNLWLGSATKRAAAVCALTELLVVALCSMIVMAPGHHLALASALTGGLGLIASAGYLVTNYMTHRTLKFWRTGSFDGGQFALTFVSIAVYSTLIYAPHHHGHSVGTVAGLLIWLMFSGLTEVAYLASQKD